MFLRIKRSRLNNEVGEVMCVEHQFPGGKAWERHSIPITTVKSKPYEIGKDKDLNDGKKYFTAQTLPEQVLPRQCDPQVCDKR